MDWHGPKEPKDQLPKSSRAASQPAMLHSCRAGLRQQIALCKTIVKSTSRLSAVSYTAELPTPSGLTLFLEGPRLCSRHSLASEKKCKRIPRTTSKSAFMSSWKDSSLEKTAPENTPSSIRGVVVHARRGVHVVDLVGLADLHVALALRLRRPRQLN